MEGFLGLSWGGVLELVEQLLYIYFHVDVQYASLVVPVQVDATVDTHVDALGVVMLDASVYGAKD